MKQIGYIGKLSQISISKCVWFCFAGEEVKQADVILMGFPLMMSMPEDVRKNDLHIYENVTNFSAFRN